MNHRRAGSVSQLVLCLAPILAYLSTHRLCDFQQFCPGSNVQVKLEPADWRPSDLFLQCSDQVTGTYVKNFVFSVLSVNLGE